MRDIAPSFPDCEDGFTSLFMLWLAVIFTLSAFASLSFNDKDTHTQTL